MIIVLKPRATQADIDHVSERLRKLGLKVHVSQGEERTILVRDTNKVVALSVLKNPRITEQEVESIAAMRNVSDEVLRAVGMSREWSKSYTVAAALVRNPRTPPGISTNFVPRLTNRDLKFLATDKNVPEIIRRNAKRTYDLRNQKSNQVSFKKK